MQAEGEAAARLVLGVSQPPGAARGRGRPEYGERGDAFGTEPLTCVELTPHLGRSTVALGHAPLLEPPRTRGRYRGAVAGDLRLRRHRLGDDRPSCPRPST